MVLGKLDRYMQKNETRPHSYITHKNKSKMDQNLNARPETIKILEESIGSKTSDTSLRNFLLDISPQARESKEKINKWDYIKLKNFCTVEKIINKIKDNPQNGRTFLPIHLIRS